RGGTTGTSGHPAPTLRTLTVGGQTARAGVRSTQRRPDRPDRRTVRPRRRGHASSQLRRLSNNREIHVLQTGCPQHTRTLSTKFTENAVVIHRKWITHAVCACSPSPCSSIGRCISCR